MTPPRCESASPPLETLAIRVRGRVQGVGFRPFLARTAADCGVVGWAANSWEGVSIHAEGPPPAIAEFLRRVAQEPPPAAVIDHIDACTIDHRLGPLAGFRIVASSLARPVAMESGWAVIAADMATCRDCLAEFLNPSDRRYGYAMACCTACGPRFTTQRSIPFDRERTTLDAFPMCPACLAEYDSPTDRRFHAQNVTCPNCGPRLWFESCSGEPGWEGLLVAERAPALSQAARWLQRGAIIAVKGIGGVHLVCDATSDKAVERLRSRKYRERKPLAVLFVDLSEVAQHGVLDDASRKLLAQPEAPIVIISRRPQSSLSRAIAPGLRTIGVMLGYSLIHQGLLRAAGRPLVATSANAIDEPMPIDNDDIRGVSRGVADGLLLHDRPIVRHADDSIARMVAGRPVWLRLGRGVSPLRISVPGKLVPTLALGGHLKSAIALGSGGEIVLGPHIGDLTTAAARRRFRDVVDDLRRLYGATFARVVCDLHPDYFTTQFAETLDLPVVAVQHHHAHIAACLAEHRETGPVLGIAWDGAGFGTDGTIWGGEFLRVAGARVERVGSLRPFSLVGGDRAARDPSRCAACAGFAAGLWPPVASAFATAELRLLHAALRTEHLAIACTSAGRLFDAWAFWLGLGERSAYEAEAPMRLEDCADRDERGEFPVQILESSGPESRLQIDWMPWVHETLRLMKQGVPASILSARFHNSLARGCLEVARRVGLPTVALGGGCFQNVLLTERIEALLLQDGFHVLSPNRVPPGDGGLAVGQIWAAAAG